MDGSTRRTRFETRVTIERDFLTRVNSIFGETAPLAGMTRDAIDSWSLRATEKFQNPEIRTIAHILVEASTRAAFLADNSKDVFEPERRPKIESMSQLIDLLDNSLNAIHLT